MTHFLSAARRIINDGATLADVSSDILVLVGMSLVFLIIGTFSQCYTCKFGRTCTDGNIVKDNGLVDKVTPDMLPREFDKQSEALAKCENAAHLLNDILSIALR